MKKISIAGIMALALLPFRAGAVMNGQGQDIVPVTGVFQSSISVAGDVTASRYQIKGSTVLALLPGAGSIGIGAEAGAANTGARNIFLGYTAGQNNSVATDNVFIGDMAGNTNTSGAKNTFIGSSAGTMNLTGEYNTLVGYIAGQRNSAGSGNTALGYGAAGNGGGGLTYSSNTVVGYQAGYSLLAGGNDNILIGWKAGYTTTTGTGNIIIGYNKNATAAGASNELNIGGLIFGDMSIKKVGIGTSSIGSALVVKGTTTEYSSSGLNVTDSAGKSLLLVRNDGRVGINDAFIAPNPYARLTIAGDSAYTGGGGGQLKVAGSSDYNQWIEVGYNTSTNVGFVQAWKNGDSAKPISLNADGGNVGVGIAVPNAKLHVSGGDAAVTTQGNGLILRATDGSNCYRVTVNDAGSLSTALVACP